MKYIAILLIAVFMVGCYQSNALDTENETPEAEAKEACLKENAEFTIEFADGHLMYTNTICCDLVIEDEYLYAENTTTMDSITVNLSTGETLLSIYNKSLPVRLRADYEGVLNVKGQTVWGDLNDNVNVFGYYESEGL